MEHRDLHGSYAKEFIDNYADDRTCSGKRRPAPFDKPRDSIDATVVDITRQRYEHLAHTEGALICWTYVPPLSRTNFVMKHYVPNRKQLLLTQI